MPAISSAIIIAITILSLLVVLARQDGTSGYTLDGFNMLICAEHWPQRVKSGLGLVENIRQLIANAVADLAAPAILAFRSMVHTLWTLSMLPLTVLVYFVIRLIYAAVVVTEHFLSYFINSNAYYAVLLICVLLALALIVKIVFELVKLYHWIIQAVKIYIILHHLVF